MAEKRARKGKGAGLRLVPPVKLYDYQGMLKEAIEHEGFEGAMAYAVVAVLADGSVTSTFSTGESGVFQLLGALDLLRDRVLERAR